MKRSQSSLHAAAEFDTAAKKSAPIDDSAAKKALLSKPGLGVGHVTGFGH